MMSSTVSTKVKAHSHKTTAKVKLSATAFETIQASMMPVVKQYAGIGQAQLAITGPPAKAVEGGAGAAEDLETAQDEKEDADKLAAEQLAKAKAKAKARAKRLRLEKDPEWQRKEWLKHIGEHVASAKTLIATATAYACPKSGSKVPKDIARSYKAKFEVHSQNLRESREHLEAPNLSKEAVKTQVKTGQQHVLNYKEDAAAFKLMVSGYPPPKAK